MHNTVSGYFMGTSSYKDFIIIILFVLCDQCLMLVSCICRHKLKCEEELNEKRRHLELKEKQLQG